jgi:hypothetical protein
MPGRWSSVPGPAGLLQPGPAARAHGWHRPGRARSLERPGPRSACISCPGAGTRSRRRSPAAAGRRFGARDGGGSATASAAWRSRTRPSARSDSASSAASTTHRPSSSRLPVACYSTGTFTAVSSRAGCSPGPGPVARTGPASPAMTRWRPTARRCTQLVTPPAGPSPGPHRPAARLRRQSAPEP